MTSLLGRSQGVSVKRITVIFCDITSSNVLNEKAKKLVVECFTVSEKRPKDALIESSSNVHRVKFWRRLENLVFNI